MNALPEAKREMANKQSIATNFLDACSACGMCEAVCPAGAVTLRLSSTGRWIPEIDLDHCTGCQLCREVCPHSAFSPPSVKEHEIAGNVLAIFLAHASIPSLRLYAASGGVVTALLLTWLNIAPSHRALVTLPSAVNSDPLMPRPQITSDPDIIQQAAGSHYTASPTMRALRGFPAEELASLAVVGLPCQLQALNKWTNKLSVSVGPRIGLFCAGAKDGRFSRWLLSRMRLPRSKVMSFYTRRGPWPGLTVATLTDGSRRTLPKDDPAVEFLWRNFTFAYPACLFCTDPFARHADIACGDPWGFQYASDAGNTIVVLRTPAGVDLWETAVREGIVEIVAEKSLSDFLKIRTSELARARRAHLVRYYLSGSAPPRNSTFGERLKARLMIYRWRVSSFCAIAWFTSRLPTFCFSVLKRLRV